MTLNCGGSSIKFRLLQMPEKAELARGQVAGLGTTRTTFISSFGSKLVERAVAAPDHTAALGLILEAIPKTELARIEAVGHRCVHDGGKYAGAVLIDAGVIKTITDYCELAPLHNPHNLLGIKACQKLLPGILQVAVFDSTYNRTLRPEAYLYGLPYEYYTDFGVRRYGFHGITFSYMTRRAAELLQKPLEELKIVSLMLGSGTTANATAGGYSVDISTGFTPTEGLIQSTRCGDIDPLAITYLMRKLDLNPAQMEQILNQKSGWLGISGLSSNIRDLEEAAALGHQRASMALDTFVYRAKKYVGAYAAAMGGIDALVFSGGIGERSPTIRLSICQGLEFLGLYLDHGVNKNLQGEGIISAPSSPAAILVVLTDEEMVIASETYQLLSGKKEMV